MCDEGVGLLLGFCMCYITCVEWMDGYAANECAIT